MPNRRRRRNRRHYNPTTYPGYSRYDYSSTSTYSATSQVPYPRYPAYDFSSAPTTYSATSQVSYPRYRAYNFSSAPTTYSATSQVRFPAISQRNPITSMPPTLPTVVPSTARTIENTRNGLRIQIATSVNEPAVAEPPVDDDVVYLYSVSGGQLVEVVDLAEDTETRESNPPATRNFILSNDGDPAREATTNLNSPLIHQLQGRDIEVVCISDNSKGSSEKTAVKPAGTKKRKRSPFGEARCIICDMNYERITKGGGELYSSRCGHLFCMACVKNLDPYKCTECDNKISNLWKIYL